MELTHEFTVPAAIDVAWDAFNDLERIAPCFPGASLTSFDGEAFEGLCKVKLGPISLQYTGSGRFVERDEEAHRAIIEAKGKDKRGNGTASAHVTATLTAAGNDATEVTVKTDLSITGKPAQFGRGVMQDVSDKLLGQFAACLETRLGAPAEAAAAESPTPSSTEDTPIAAEAAAAANAGAADAPTTQVPTEQASTVSAAAPRADFATTTSTPPPSPSTASATARGEVPAAELDLGATVLPVLVRRYAPTVIAVVVVLWALRKLLRRR